MDKKPQSIKEAVASLRAIQDLPLTLPPVDVPLQEQVWLFTDSPCHARHNGAAVDQHNRFPVPHRVDRRLRFIWLDWRIREDIPRMKMPGTIIISDEVQRSAHYNPELHAILGVMQRHQHELHGNNAIWITL